MMLATSKVNLVGEARYSHLQFPRISFRNPWDYEADLVTKRVKERLAFLDPNLSTGGRVKIPNFLVTSHLALHRRGLITHGHLALVGTWNRVGQT